MIRVGICDDHTVVREGLRDLISSFPDMVVTMEGRSGHEALDIARNLRCDVMLLDISMPSQSGIDVLRTIKKGQPNFPVLVLSSYPAAQYALNVMRMGANGYLEKTCGIGEITTAIRTVAAGRRHIGPEVGSLLANDFCEGAPIDAHVKLSDREFQVFLRLCKGETVTAIAEQLCLSVKTVSTYRGRVLEKMDVRSNSELTYYAMKHGLLD